MSKSLDIHLSWQDRVELRFHLMVCDPCSHFIKQLKVMKQAFGLMEPRIDNNQKLALSNVAKNVLRKHKILVKDVCYRPKADTHIKLKPNHIIHIGST